MLLLFLLLIYCLFESVFWWGLVPCRSQSTYFWLSGLDMEQFLLKGIFEQH